MKPGLAGHVRSGRLQFVAGGVLLTLLFLGSALAQPAAPRSLRVALDNHYPPFGFQDSEGRLQGLLVEQWRLWEQQTGIRVELCPLNWGEALRRMRAGEFDVLDGAFKTPERTTYLDFSKPYARIDVAIFFDREIAGLTDLKSLQGFAVAAKAGDAALDLLQQQGVSPVLCFTNYEAIVKAAAAHKVNVFVMDLPPALYLLHKLGLQNHFRHSAPVNTGQFHRAVRKGDTALLKTVEQGFAALDGAALQRIEERWHGQAVSGHPPWRYLGYVVTGAGVAILGLGVWNLALNRLVSRRTAALRQSERKYRSIIENAPGGIFQSTVTGQLLGINAAAVRMFGFDSEQDFLARAQDIANQLFANPEQRQHIVQQVLASRQFVRNEVHYRRKDGSVFLANMYARAVRDERGQPAFLEGFVEDITERKRAEAELRRTNRTLRMLSECHQELVHATEETRLLQAVCRLAVAAGGYRMAWVGLAEPDDARSVRPVAQAGFESGYLEQAKVSYAENERGRGPTGTATRTGQPVVIRNLVTDPAFGPWRQAALERGYAACAAFPLKNGAAILGALTVYAAEPDTFDSAEVALLRELADDLGFGVATLRTRAEHERVLEELHRLSARLLEVRDHEQRRLARELHDTTAQHLAVLTLNLAGLKNLVRGAAGRAEALCADCVELAHQAAQELRTHAYLLHPPLLEALGLAGAVEEYLEGFASRSGLSVELEIPADFGRLHEDLELALFRVVQESLANVLRHARSPRAKIRFTRREGSVSLEIQDMGQGIPADKLARLKATGGGSGVGFGGMQERLRLLGGRLELESSGAGTTVRATVPLAGAPAGNA